MLSSSSLFLLSLALPIIAYAKSSPLRITQRVFPSNNGATLGDLYADALAQSSLQSGEDFYRGLEFATLPGNFTDEEKRASKSEEFEVLIQQVTKYEIDLPSKQKVNQNQAKSKVVTQVLTETLHQKMERFVVQQEITVAEPRTHIDSQAPLAHADSSSLTATFSAPATTSTTPPITYTPGWCGIHVKQVLHPTCLYFNTQDCIRINSTISLYDHAQQLLTSTTITLTHDGMHTFALDSALPFPISFTQLGAVEGINAYMGNAGNLWPMRMAYEGADGGKGKKEWRNDDRRVCESGQWDWGMGFWNVGMESREFDCGFSCPA